MKLYYKDKDGATYYGYKLELTYCPPRITEDMCFFNRSAILDYKNLFDNSFIPSQGSEISVIPNCPISHDDIRNSYKIKRGFDTGICNVFPDKLTISHYIDLSNLIIFPKIKLAIGYNSKNISYNSLLTQFKIDPKDALSSIQIPTWVTLCCTRLHEAYQALYRGSLSKPAISYRNLKIKGKNQLTADALYLVYRLGREKVTQDNIRTFELQLKALSQTNWRDYSNVIEKLITIIKNNNSVGNYVLTHKSCMSKQSRQFLDFKSSGETEDEFNLGKDMMKLIMDLDGTIFTTFEDVFVKLRNTGVGFNSFNHYFKNMIKISERKFNE